MTSVVLVVDGTLVDVVDVVLGRLVEELVELLVDVLEDVLLEVEVVLDVDVVVGPVVGGTPVVEVLVVVLGQEMPQQGMFRS